MYKAKSFIQIVFFLNISMPEDICFLFEQNGITIDMMGVCIVKFLNIR
jgi:hypothetical protein